MFEDIFRAKANSLRFTGEAVPEEVLEKALQAGNLAPSVGLPDTTRYYLIKTPEVRQEIKKLFLHYKQPASEQGEYPQKTEAIEQAPQGLVVCYDRFALDSFMRGAVASMDAMQSSAVCAVQNTWLSLSEQGYTMKWVSVPDLLQLKHILKIPSHIEPLGYFCIGKQAINDEKHPLLQPECLKQRVKNPLVTEVGSLPEPAIKEAKKPNSLTHENNSLTQQLQHIIDHKTKPTGALGLLEGLALQIGKVFRSTAPEIKHPHLVVFAADHGIAQHGVSAYPPEVTSQMVMNFLNGGAAINVFSQQHELGLTIVDAGVNYDFPPHLPLVNLKMSRGTRSFLHGPAMSLDQVHTCLKKGGEVTEKIQQGGCNTIGFGEMGIGNTSTAAVLMSMLGNFPIEQCIGKGTGVVKEQLTRKQQLLQQAVTAYQGNNDVYSIMAHFGGYEIVMMAGAMLEARNRKMLLLVDGFISSVAFLCAYQLNPEVKENAVFCHQSDEAGHQLLLQALQVRPLLQLNMRLGEGTGCAIAFPLLKSAVAFLNEMSSFESAGVSNKT